jgi:hypothetical protein
MPLTVAEAFAKKFPRRTRVSRNIRTVADVRCRTPAPSNVRIDVARRAASSRVKLCANRRAT